MSNITKKISAGVAGTICLPTAVLESSVEPYLELSDFLVYYAIQCSINNANKGLEPEKQLKNVINVEQIATRLNYPIAKVYDAMLRLRNGCYIDFTGFTAKKAVLTLKRDPKDDALMIDGLYYFRLWMRDLLCVICANGEKLSKFLAMSAFSFG